MSAIKTDSLTRRAATDVYPEINPFHRFELSVGDGHTVYVEECGNPDGVPFLFVHGGPGGGSSTHSRRFFDPDFYRIVLFDQRGCGRSRPLGETENNTTWHLVNDMEKIRTELDIERWALFGGSWGSTLSLAYAQAHPQQVTALVLRGILLAREKDYNWLYLHTAPDVYPDHYAKFISPVPKERRADIVPAYHDLLNSPDEDVRLKAAQTWMEWEFRTSTLIPAEEYIAARLVPEKALPMARLETHYFVNGCFLDHGQLLRDAARIRHLPCVIVQGRYDLNCNAEAAWALKCALPEATLEWVADAGHSVREPGIASALIGATDRLKDTLASQKANTSGVTNGSDSK